jgi:protein TonB
VKLTLTLALSIAGLSLSAQPDSIKPEPKLPSRAERFPDKQAEFPGGADSLNAYFDAHVRYPAEAAANKIEGTVYLKLIIRADGSVQEAVVQRGLGYGCDEEAVRVALIMPAWTPGMLSGKAVATYYTLAVPFKL